MNIKRVDIPATFSIRFASQTAELCAPGEMLVLYRTYSFFFQKITSTQHFVLIFYSQSNMLTSTKTPPHKKVKQTNTIYTKKFFFNFQLFLHFEYLFICLLHSNQLHICFSSIIHHLLLVRHVGVFIKAHMYTYITKINANEGAIIQVDIFHNFKIIPQRETS